MTVFIVPPRYVFLKIDHQPVGRGESLRVLGSAKMAVITFSDFVVVTHHADDPDNVSQPVFEFVRRASNRFWNPPQNQFSERVSGIDDARACNQRCIHAGGDAT